MFDTLTVNIIGCSVIFLAALTSGLTGTGYALISVPILIVFLPPKLVVPVIMILSALINLYILVDARRWIDLRRIWLLTIAGIAGMPLGTYMLKVINVNLLKVFIGGVIVCFALAFLKGVNMKIKNEKLACVPIGFLSGFLNGSTSMCGPPVILFFTNQGVKKSAFRANIVAYFILLNLVTIPYFALNGLITSSVIRYSLLFLPAMIIGATIGIKLSHRVREDIFRRIVLIIVTVAGLFSIASGIGLLK